jgi:hypothetical protein
MHNAEECCKPMSPAGKVGELGTFRRFVEQQTEDGCAEGSVKD